MRRTVPLLILAAIAIPGCTKAWSSGSRGTVCEPCVATTAPSKCRNWCKQTFSSTSHCGPNRYNARQDRHVVCTTAKARADRALKRYRKESGIKLSCHFCTGFEQAYCDIAQGGTGALPPLPPARYWHVCYRTEAGFGRADEWFEGYRIGASWAEAEGMTQFNHIAVSPPPPPPAAPGGACGAALPGPGPGYINQQAGSNHGGTPVIGAPEYVGPGAKLYAPVQQPQPPMYGTPQFGGPQYGAPQYPGPQYPGPQYPAGQYPPPQYPAPQYPAPQYPIPQQPGTMPTY